MLSELAYIETYVMRTRLIQKFLQLESASGIFLFVATFVAMIWANSRYAYSYQQFTSLFLFWINEGLMTIFFLVVGMELKRGYIDGKLGDPSQILLPLVAALGGMLVPVLIYYSVNHRDPVALQGWSIPVATDIAFALGVLSFFKDRVPIALKLFLLSLAIFDDVGAILIIAVFFTKSISYLLLFQSLILVVLLYFLNVVNIRSLLPYLFLGIWLWLALLHSGIHPTIAGVLLAMMIPDGRRKGYSPLRSLEEVLHPIAAYLIMPLFALANAGFLLSGVTWDVLLDGVVLGTVLGLFIGKPLGVFTFSWLLINFRLATLPKQATWLSFFGIAVLCGVGFTMSLFLGTLSFQNEDRYLAEVRIGVIIGSILSGIVGAVILYRSIVRKKYRSKFVD